LISTGAILSNNSYLVRKTTIQKVTMYSSELILESYEYLQVANVTIYCMI